MISTYVLTQQFLEFKKGTPVTVEGEMGYLGRLPWGWEIPLFIIERNPNWFQKVTK